jgi:dienelactone hydrolase
MRRRAMRILTTWIVLSISGLLFGTDSGLRAEPPVFANVDHSNLMVYWTPDGLRPVQTPADWAIRRRQIIAGMEAAMGKLPDRSRLPPPDMKVIERVERDGFVRLEIAYLAEENRRVPAYLLLPADCPPGKRLPAMLTLHQTTPLEKKEVAGEGGLPNLAYAKELAQRGYVVLAPDYPSLGDYAYDFHQSKYASGTMLGIFNNIRGIDLLQARGDVDPQRIGVIGHSLGGHNAMFVGAFDPRLKVIVSSCGWNPFHDYKGGNLAGWDQDRYMPRIRTKYGNDPNRVPFDFYEVVAALAPRAFFSNSPLHDDNFAVGGVKKAEAKARQVYALLGAADQLQIRYPDCGHDFPPEVRREAYRFIDRILQHTPTTTHHPR